MFIGASYDHSVVTALWSLSGDDSVLQEYKKSLQTYGLPSDKIQLGLRLTTSDTGVSGANLYPTLFLGKDSMNLPLDSPLKLEHKNKADMSKFDSRKIIQCRGVGNCDMPEDVKVFVHQYEKNVLMHAGMKLAI